MENRGLSDREHKVIITGREKMLISGVEDVDSFEENKIVAYTSEGVMTIKGGDFHINKLTVEDGELEIVGIVDSIFYEEGRKNDGGGFFSKIFK